MTLRRTLRRKRKRSKTRKTKKGGAAADDEYAREDTAFKELLEFHNLQPSGDVNVDINNIYNKLNPTTEQKFQFAYTLLKEDERLIKLAQQINSGEGKGRLKPSTPGPASITKFNRDLKGMFKKIGEKTERSVGEGPIPLEPIPEEN